MIRDGMNVTLVGPQWQTQAEARHDHQQHMRNRATVMGVADRPVADGPGIHRKRTSKRASVISTNALGKPLVPKN